MVWSDGGLYWGERYLKPVSDIVVTYVKRGVQPRGTSRSVLANIVFNPWLTGAGILAFTIAAMAVFIVIRRGKRIKQGRIL